MPYPLRNCMYCIGKFYISILYRMEFWILQKEMVKTQFTVVPGKTDNVKEVYVEMRYRMTQKERMLAELPYKAWLDGLSEDRMSPSIRPDIRSTRIHSTPAMSMGSALRSVTMSGSEEMPASCRALRLAIMWSSEPAVW